MKMVVGEDNKNVRGLLSAGDDDGQLYFLTFQLRPDHDSRVPMSTHAWWATTVYQSDHDFRAVLWPWGQGGLEDSIVMFLNDISSIIIPQLLLPLFSTKERMAWIIAKSRSLMVNRTYLTQGGLLWGFLLVLSVQLDFV